MAEQSIPRDDLDVPDEDVSRVLPALAPKGKRLGPAVALAVAIAAIVLLVSGGSGDGAGSYVKGHWPNWNAAQAEDASSSFAENWPAGRFASCAKSTRMFTNYACYYRDSAGRTGYVCVLENFGSSPRFEINTAVGPGDPRRWYQDDGTVSTPEQVC